MLSRLYAMDTSFYHAHGRYRPRARAEMLKELGYSGCNVTLWDDHAWSQLPAVIEAVDRAGIALVGLYLTGDVSTGQLDERLGEAMHMLAGRTALVELALRGSSSHDQPSSPRALPRAAEMVKRLADQTAEAGLQLSLYPHQNFWMERLEDAVRLMMRVNRADLGVTFNAFHWLATDGTALEARLQLAVPRLCNVTICGMTRRGLRDCTIEPLDAGGFDNFHLLGMLARFGYAGPIGLQGYGIGGDVYANLRRSLAAYRDMLSRLSAHANWSILEPPGP